MILLKARLRQPIDEDETSHAAKELRGTRGQLEHQRRGIAYRAGNVGEDHQIDVARTARAKLQLRERAAMLNRRADGAAEIDASPLRHAQTPPEPDPEPPRDRGERIARLVEFEIRVALEGSALDLPAPRVMTARLRGILFAGGSIALRCFTTFFTTFILTVRFGLARFLRFRLGFVFRFLVSFLLLACGRSYGLLVLTHRADGFAFDFARAGRDGRFAAALAPSVVDGSTRAAEERHEQLFEDLAVVLVLYERGGQCLAHRGALKSGRADCVHRVESFGDRDPHARAAQLIDEAQEFVAQRSHRQTSARDLSARSPCPRPSHDRPHA